MKLSVGIRVAALALIAAEPLLAQTPPQTWQHITYPTVTIPGTATEQLGFLVSSDAEPSHLLLYLMWTTTEGGRRPMPDAIADAKAIVVKLHTAGGPVLTSQNPQSWGGIGNSLGMTRSLVSLFPWSHNALDEAWFEVRAGAQTWWIELPYGLARNPADPEIPDSTRDVPGFPATMRIGASDILVPWLGIEYDFGRIDGNPDLTLHVGSGIDPRVSVTLRRASVAIGNNRQSLDTPRVAVNLDLPGRNVAVLEARRSVEQDEGTTRIDEFILRDRSSGKAGRTFGTITIAIDEQRYAVRVPSSLFLHDHHRTDPQNRQWMTGLQ